ncbi:hypothetical protein Tco_0829368 [Tanacetum coccineum]
MDNPNITMEEYIRLEEEKARRHGKVYNWETAKYGKIWYDEDVHDLRSVETEFPAIVFNDELSSKKHSFVNPRYVNDLKTDSENDNEKVNMPSFLSPEPKVSCFDDLDFFKDFENEFSAIVYNDALTSKSDYLTEPTLSPQHIDEFDFKDETSLSEYDEVEQNISIRHMAILAKDQRHQYLRFEGLQYTNNDIADFEERLGRIDRADG